MKPGWTELSFREAWSKGRAMIHRIEPGFVISYNECWMPGCYATFDAAERAFELTEDQRCALRDAAVSRGDAITVADIDQAVAS